jgi:energy-coupling factor transport system permease protein
LQPVATDHQNECNFPMSVLQFINKNTLIHRLSPLTKIFMLVSLFIISLYSYNLVILLIIIAGVMVVWGIARIPLRNLKMAGAVLAGMMVLFVFFNGFFYYFGVTPLFTLFKWTFTLEGLFFGIAMTAKVAAVILAIPILTMTTPVSRFMAALAKLKLPYKFIFAFGTAMRFVPLVQETYSDIQDAQKLRAHDLDEMNFVNRVRYGFVPIVIPLFLSLLRKTQDLDIAIESRAFGAPVQRTYLESIQLQANDILFILITLLFCVGLIVSSNIFGLEAGLSGIYEIIR